jgi:serine protease inhibitor
MFRMPRTIKKRVLAALLTAAVFLLPACGSGPKPTPTATPAIAPAPGSFADGRGLVLGFKLLYALDEGGGNGVLDTTGLASVLAAVKDGAAGDTETALAMELGMQEIPTRQVDDLALRMRQAMEKLTMGKYCSAWGLFVPEDLYIKLGFDDNCRQSLQMTPDFHMKYPFDGEAVNAYLGEWLDEKTSGRMKDTDFTFPDANGPFFVDVLTADPDWQTALETGKSRPLPFHFEGGEEKAVPTMVCLQDCGIYECPEGSMAILPTAGDETRVVVMQPPDGMSLHEFIPIASEKHDEWIQNAKWDRQRVLLPRFSLNFDGSAMGVLDAAGIGGLMGEDSDFSDLGIGLHFSDILLTVSLVMDESGVEPPDPSMPTYRPNNKDDIPTFAVDRPFVVLLEKTDKKSDLGQALMMGVVRDPLNND